MSNQTNNFKIPTRKYAVSYRNFGLDPNSDKDPSSISSQDVSNLANKDYQAAIGFLRKLSYEDQTQIIKGMQKKFFTGHTTSIEEDVTIQSRAPFSDRTPFWRVVRENKCPQETEKLTDDSGKLQVDKKCAFLLQPEHLPFPISNFFNGDSELSLSDEIYTEANCISYALKNIFPQISFHKEGLASDKRQVTWQDLFIDPSNVETIDGILSRYSQRQATYPMKKGEEVEEFAYRVEQQILSNSSLRPGDIVTISYVEDGKKKYSHMAILETGKKKRLILIGKIGPNYPVIKTSIASQIIHYSQGLSEIKIEVFHPSKS